MTHQSRRVPPEVLERVRELEAEPGPIGRFFRLFRRYPIVWAVILIILGISAAFAPWISPYDPIRDADFTAVRVPPFWQEGGSTAHLLGTDPVGRDVLSRVIHGSRVSLMVATVAIISGTIFGTALGLISGFMGGQVDEVIMRFVDMWLSLPFILLALVIAIVLGQSYGVMFLLLALISWTGFVRPVRGEVLSLKTRDYVQAARIAGASTLHSLVHHILPGVTSTVIVLATLRAGGLVLAESVLSYLGVGIPPPTPTWGGMVADGRNYLDGNWWISTMPGIGIFLLVMSLNFVGDWLRDRWDPRLRQQI